VMRRSIPQFAPGRAEVGGSAQVMQVARPDPARPLAEHVAARAESHHGDPRHAGHPGQPPLGGPPPVGVLPESVALDALLGAGRSERGDGGVGGVLFIPIGIGDETLEPTGFELYEGDHVLIAGPARTGRTTSLLVVAEVVSRLYPDIELTGVAMRRSALRDCGALRRVITATDQLAELASELRASDRLQLLLIDDADVVDDPARALSDLFSAPLASLHAVVAGRTDALRSLGHWSVGVRRSRTGLLLQPDVTVDGPLLGVTLPRRPLPPVRPGCGYRVDAGGFELVQVALPEVNTAAAARR
jgi:S-DNA-T family DNA segregation ATPase FtsK/SpoIIIE